MKRNMVVAMLAIASIQQSFADRDTKVHVASEMNASFQKNILLHSKVSSAHHRDNLPVRCTQHSKKHISDYSFISMSKRCSPPAGHTARPGQIRRYQSATAEGGKITRILKYYLPGDKAAYFISMETQHHFSIIETYKNGLAFAMRSIK